MRSYIVTGIFAVEIEVEDSREAKVQAEQKLRRAGIECCVIEVRKKLRRYKNTRRRE